MFKLCLVLPNVCKRQTSSWQDEPRSPVEGTLLFLIVLRAHVIGSPDFARVLHDDTFLAIFPVLPMAV